MAVKIESHLRSAKSSDRSLHFGGGAYHPQEPENSRALKAAIVAAILLHAILFVVSFPDWHKEPKNIAMDRALYVVEQVRFKPPPPRQQEKRQPKKKTKKIPIPDPTPDDPEPILIEEIDVPDIELEDDPFGEALDIPEGPVFAGLGGPMWIEGNVQPPQKIFGPEPRYTEEARKARVQGIVILQAIVDALGNVSNVKIVKGLPEGLDQSAVATVQSWRYKPATLEGEPVPVYMNITVSFSLQ